MPRVGELDGIKFYIYAADHNPPHVHVYYGDDAAIVTIAGREVLEGTLPRPQLRAAKAWIQENEQSLQAKWDELNSD